MKRVIKELKGRADDEAELLALDLGMFTLASEKEGRWNGSDAQQLLKQDMERNLHTRLAPKALYHLRPEYYKEFTLKQFRDHIQQEKRSKLETNYWIVKKKRKEGLLKLDIDDNDDGDYFVDANAN